MLKEKTRWLHILGRGINPTVVRAGLEHKQLEFDTVQYKTQRWEEEEVVLHVKA